MEDHAEADKNLIDSLHYLLFSVCYPSLTQLFSTDYMPILSIYPKQCSQSSTRCLRKRAAVHMQGTVYLRKIEIIPTIRNLCHI